MPCVSRSTSTNIPKCILRRMRRRIRASRGPRPGIESRNARQTGRGAASTELRASFAPAPARACRETCTTTRATGTEAEVMSTMVVAGKNPSFVYRRSSQRWKTSRPRINTARPHAATKETAKARWREGGRETELGPFAPCSLRVFLRGIAPSRSLNTLSEKQEQTELQCA